MGEYAIQAAENTYRQAREVGMANIKVRAWLVAAGLGCRREASGQAGRLAGCRRAWLSQGGLQLAGRQARVGRQACRRTPPGTSTIHPCLPPQIGNTPMIGLNDVETETFNQTDAHKVSLCHSELVSARLLLPPPPPCAEPHPPAPPGVPPRHRLQLGAWAAATPWLRWTAFWSVARDKFNGET